MDGRRERHRAYLADETVAVELTGAATSALMMRADEARRSPCAAPVCSLRVARVRKLMAVCVSHCVFLRTV